MRISYGKICIIKCKEGGIFVSDKILVVDDEKEIADLVAFYLESENFDVTVCYTGV